MTCLGVGDALRQLGFKVYDFEAASKRYERDFPLWLEAAQLRHTGRSYTKSDYDKLIGDHDAIVGAPACYFHEDLVKLYPNVKVILVSRDTNADIVVKLLEMITSRFWQQVDPTYFGTIHRFLKLHANSNEACRANNEILIRETVRAQNLLEIRNLIAWVPLCEFLGVRNPEATAPDLHDDNVAAQLSGRPLRAIIEKVSKFAHRGAVVLTNSLTMAAITLASALAVLLGSIGLIRVSSYSFQLVCFLMVRSQVRDMARLLAVGMSFCALTLGFLAGYRLALWRYRPVPHIESPRRGNQHKFKNGRKRGKQGRERQTENKENARPERPTLGEWSGVQADIRQDDARMQDAGRAIVQEWRDGKDATFHVTHKHTETGQALFNGPRKVLSITKETIQ